MPCPVGGAGGVCPDNNKLLDNEKKFDTPHANMLFTLADVNLFEVKSKYELRIAGVIIEMRLIDVSDV